jgi:hypothetical protein
VPSRGDSERPDVTAEHFAAADRLVDDGSKGNAGGEAMNTSKARVLGLVVTAIVAMGLVAAVAMARSQPDRRQPQQQQQPAEPLPVGGPSQAGLFLPA